MKKIVLIVSVSLILIGCKKSTWIISNDDYSKFVRGTYSFAQDEDEDVFNYNGKAKLVDFDDSFGVALFDVDNEIIRNGSQEEVPIVFIITEDDSKDFRNIIINEKGYLIFNMLNYYKVKRMIEDADRVSFTYKTRGRVIGAIFYLKE
jgi:hypothetical protein